MKMFARLIVCLLIFVFTTNASFSQENGPPKKDQSIKSKRKLRKADKKKWKEDRAAKRAEEKKIRNHHKRIQTKEVRKRMKRSKVKAQRNHDNVRTPFFERLFSKNKKNKTPKKTKEKIRK